MKLILLGVGKNKHDFVEDGLQEFSKRIERFYSFESEFIPGIRKSKGLSAEQIRQKESEIIEKHLSAGDYIVLLDEKGRQFTSIQFADKLNTWLGTGHKRIVFVIGGAMGHSPKLKASADQILSLSPMTYSHQMIRLVFAEQLYRAATIIHNHPYHNE